MPKRGILYRAKFQPKFTKKPTILYKYYTMLCINLNISFTGARISQLDQPSHKEPLKPLCTVSMYGTVVYSTQKNASKISESRPHFLMWEAADSDAH